MISFVEYKVGDVVEVGFVSFEYVDEMIGGSNVDFNIMREVMNLGVFRDIVVDVGIVDVR